MPKTTLPIEIKISTVVAISTILHSADLEAIDSALASMTGGVSDFFEDEFAVIDVSAFTSSAWTIDWAAIVALLKKYRLNAVAVISLSEIAPAALQQHVFWGSLLLGLLLWGPGRWSLDQVLAPRWRARGFYTRAA